LANSIDLPERIRDAAAEALLHPSGVTLLHRPHIPETAWTYVKECLDTGWVSSAGDYVSKFEEQLAEFTGCKRAIATVNGTAALEVCLFLAGVRPGDEVICPSLTFVATANAISHCGAIPHFVDVSEERLSIDPEQLEVRFDEVLVTGLDGARNRQTGRRVAAVCVMHCFGHPADLYALDRVCKRFEIPLIEDAAESLGSTYQGQHTGRFGCVAAVSFNGNKIITTGGGGAILTDDEELGNRAKHLTTTGKVAHPWEFFHDVVAWNYRMPNINAALGLSQLEMLPELLAAKRSVAERYRACFATIPDVRLMLEPQDCCSNYWLNCLILSEAAATARDQVLSALNSSGLQSRPIWQPMHYLPMYCDCPKTPLPVTESIYRRSINLPSSAELATGWSASHTA
jgi:perosamine synthetase